MENKEEYDIIHAYLDGLMSAEEKSKFELELKNNKKLMLDVKVYKTIKDTLEDKETFKTWKILQDVIESCRHDKKGNGCSDN